MTNLYPTKDDLARQAERLPEDVEKRLKAWSKDPERGLCADFTTEGYAYYEELQKFIADELATAMAEGEKRERERIVNLACDVSDELINANVPVIHPGELGEHSPEDIWDVAGNQTAHAFYGMLEQKIKGGIRFSPIPKGITMNDTSQSPVSGEIQAEVPTGGEIPTLASDVEKRLKEWSEDPERGLCADFTTDGYAYYDELKAFLATALEEQRAEGAAELERITKEVDSGHKALYKELEGTFCDRYSTDYKHGILRGYTLIGRMLHSNEALTTKEIDHAE